MRNLVLALAGLLAIAGCAAPAIMPATQARAAVTHNPAVTIKCTPATDNTAVDVVITNDQANGTGWMHGFTVEATTEAGTVIDQSDNTVPFRIAAHGTKGWIVGFQPHRIASCTASILWGSQ